MSWTFRDYQITKGQMVIATVKKYAMAYVNMEERTGKTGTVIYAVNKMANVNKICILTKVNAMSGWKESLANFRLNFDYDISTYHSAHKLKGNYDLVVFDESHNYISSSPKPGKIWKDVYKLVRGSLCIYVSATPHAQGYQMLYHQFKLCFNGPWEQYRNFYDWYREYAYRDEKGHTVKEWINSTLMETYKDLQDTRIKREINKYFITATRKELGFVHEPIDKIHYIELSKGIKAAYNKLLKTKVLNFRVNGVSYNYIGDTPTKLKVALHQLEGGTLIIHDKPENEDDKVIKTPVILSDNSKINFIKKHFGDTDDLVIMYNYRAELQKLQKAFKHAELAQATSKAEGVDYYHKQHLVIYSQDYSTARHVQRRARQTNLERKTPIIVHFLLVKNAISEQVYKTVVLNKKNYVDSTFERKKI